MISFMIKGGHAIRTGLLRARKAGQLHPLLAVEAIFSVFQLYFLNPFVGDSTVSTATDHIAVEAQDVTVPHFAWIS